MKIPNLKKDIGTQIVSSSSKNLFYFTKLIQQRSGVELKCLSIKYAMTDF